MRWLKLAPLVFVGACAAPITQPPEVTPPEPAPAPVPVETAPLQEEAVRLPDPEPGRLSGLNPAQVQALVGEPALVRRDGHVQIMLFETPSCVLEIIFYEANPDAHFIVDQLNARNRRGQDVDIQTCLVNILPNGQWLDAGLGER